MARDQGANYESAFAVNSSDDTEVLTFLFTDIEGSSRLWESHPDTMRQALACHDEILRSAVERNHGTVVKSTGDGLHAAFRDPRDAIATAVELQSALSDARATSGLALSVRCGMHVGVTEARDGDFFGGSVNRAARIMSAAHGGQVLASQSVADLSSDRLPVGVSLRDLGVVRLRDLASPERLFQVTHVALRQDFPPLRSLEVTPNNLPQQVTSFLGRARDIEKIRELLGTTRLLTLLGGGGIGKTRLSLQAAAEMLDDYPDGVWFVRLEALTDPRVVPQAVALVIGAKEEPGHSLTEALVGYCRARRCLLVLDNCEHLIQACAELAAILLQSGPGTKILASSREPFHTQGETIYDVPPLSTPDARSPTAPEELIRYEAVRLFAERSAQGRPDFHVTPENAAAVAEICIRLDGVPLALELAAARIRALSIDEIAKRVVDRFRLLVGGDHAALPRHQTLRALIDWSHELLTHAERTLFRRLAVFAGGWTLEAAEAVGRGKEIEPQQVVDLLTALVDKSLVVVSTRGTRYRFLETVRQYAQERLEKAGEMATIRASQVDFYLNLAEAARAGVNGPEQGAWLLRFDQERENLLAAHGYCDSVEWGGQLGLRLVYAVHPYLNRRGVLESGHQLLTDALARPGAQMRDLARCKVLFAAGWQNYYMGRYASATDYLQESLSIAREIGDQHEVARILQPLGLASLGTGELAHARQYLEEALDLARETRDKHQIAAALNALGQLTRLDGRPDKAEPLYADVLSLAREAGDRESEAFALLNLAMSSLGQGRINGVPAMLLDALAIAGEIGSMPTGQSVLEVSAGFAALKKDWRSAALFFGAAEAQAARTGLRRDPADEAFLAPFVAAARVAQGTGFFVDDAAGRALSYDAAIERARVWLATPSHTQTSGDRD
jgi:predicted ATPase/class 3 adenylate cyclase